MNCRIHLVTDRHGQELGRIFNAPKTCNGNCNQGRACDCVADVEDDWHPPFTAWGLVVILAPWAVGVVFVALASALI